MADITKIDFQTYVKELTANQFETDNNKSSLRHAYI